MKNLRPVGDLRCNIIITQSRSTLALEDRVTWQEYDQMILGPIEEKEDQDTSALSFSSRLAFSIYRARLYGKLPLKDIIY